MGNVHGGHGEAGAVDEAADSAVQLDVVDAEAAGLRLQWVLLSRVPHPEQVGVPEEGVVVYLQLGVGGQHGPVRGDDEGVHLDQRAVVGGEDDVEPLHYAGYGSDQPGVDAEAQGKRPALVWHEPEDRVDGGADYLLRGAVGDLLDVHAAGRADHHDGASLGAVDDYGGVHLLGDVDRLLHQHGIHGYARRAGLVRDEGRAEHRGGGVPGLGGGGDELDAPGLAAPAGVDLCLDDYAPAQLSGGLGPLRRGVRAILPLGTATPAAARTSLAWYSCSRNPSSLRFHRLKQSTPAAEQRGTPMFAPVCRGAWLAEGVGFEPTFPFRIPVFKTGALNHSATPPGAWLTATGTFYPTAAEACMAGGASG